MKKLILLFTLVLTGCASAPSIESSSIEVKIPVPIVCQAQEPTEPTWNAELVKLGSDVYEQMKSLLADRKMSRSYEGELREALRSCK